MRSTLLPCFSLISLFLASHSASALPRSPAAIGKSSLIRVALGTYPRFGVAGYDLSINGESLGSGPHFSKIGCGVVDGNPFVEYGEGQRSEGRLEIQSPSGFLQFQGKPYRSRLTVIPQANGCLVINTLNLEKYLVGVISKEMSPSWPLEALKAQSVASRSYALFQIASNSGKDFDVESSTQDQVYDGSASETVRTLQAVEATRGQALWYGGNTLKAYFHANCGGVTEVPTLVWGGEMKAFRSVACPYHKQSKFRSTWALRLTKQQIEGAMRKIAGALPPAFRRLASLEPGAPDLSKRLSDVSVSDATGNNVLISSNTFRNAIGNTKLKSTSFRISKEGEAYVLRGEGNGHGVGLCQVGARAMAEEGRNFRQILLFYYPLAKISTL